MSSTHQQNQHGVMMRVFNQGVLITGEPGIGKSSLALSLLQQGHQLVADDVINIHKDKQQLIASCPEELSGFLHTRELGLIDIKHIFGEQSVCSKSQIDVIVELTKRPPLSQQLQSNHISVALFGLNYPKLSLSIMSTCPVDVRLMTWLKNLPYQSQSEALFKETQKRSMQQ